MRRYQWCDVVFPLLHCTDADFLSSLTREAQARRMKAALCTVKRAAYFVHLRITTQHKIGCALLCSWAHSSLVPWPCSQPGVLRYYRSLLRSMISHCGCDITGAMMASRFCVVRRNNYLSRARRRRLVWFQDNRNNTETQHDILVRRVL